MIIFLSISVAVIASLHTYLMRSIDSYDRYGAQHTLQEWRDFERSHSVFQ